MSVVTPVLPPIVCTRCRESRPSWEFQENYGGIPGLRVCTRCNSCPDCGLRLGTVPKRKTKPISFGVRKGGMLVFNDLSEDDINQRTID